MKPNIRALLDRCIREGIDVDPDMFDELNFFELMEDDE